jgi:ADP-glucose pyrophosphorylase
VVKTSLTGDQCVRPPARCRGPIFTSVASTGVVEYRHLQENQALRSSGIRVLSIARQMKRANGSVADGSADAMANAEDLILTFRADYLASQGAQVIMFLDVESMHSLSVVY